MYGYQLYIHNMKKKKKKISRKFNVIKKGEAKWARNLNTCLYPYDYWRIKGGRDKNVLVPRLFEHKIVKTKFKEGRLFLQHPLQLECVTYYMQTANSKQIKKFNRMFLHPKH
jgi:anti-sigma factor ChrR (cupin superfamily)